MTYLLLYIESGLLVLAVVVALLLPSAGASCFQKIEMAMDRLASRRMLSAIGIGTLALILQLAFTLSHGIPKPLYKDDFCYLLSADTYAHGRLTNPTPPMWKHFESFGVIQQPTYQCIAQPAQGMVLALGKVLLGNPFWGVWLSMGAMCGAICWMLQGWLPPGWALLGAFLMLLRIGIFTYWSNTYWGGAVGAIGGALVLGALPRLKHSLRIRHSLLLGLGLALLANSRPYEGFVLGVAVACVLGFWLFARHAPAFPLLLRRFVVPTGTVLLLTAAWLTYYNWRVTGNPLAMAYQVDARAHFVAPYFLWQHLRRPEPPFNHQLLRNVYAVELVRAYHTAGSLVGVLLKAWKLWKFYFGPALTLPLFLAVFLLPKNLHWSDLSERAKTLLFIAAFGLFGLGVEVFFEAHYAAPFTSLFIVIVLLSLRRVSQWKRGGRPTGLFIVRSVVVICLVSFSIRAAATALHISLPGSEDFAWFESSPRLADRSVILSRLDSVPGCHLVLVRYDPDRIPLGDWVYNGADVDRSRVVWARAMTPAEDAEIIHYFRSRTVWLLDATTDMPELSKYPGIPSTDTAALGGCPKPN